MSAFLTNRVGDCFLTIGMFTILWSLGNLDYATVYSLAPYINENVMTIIGVCLLIGAMAKSSQLGLHVWLPMAIFFIKVANDLKLQILSLYPGIKFIRISGINELKSISRRINSLSFGWLTSYSFFALLNPRRGAGVWWYSCCFLDYSL